MNLKHWRNIAFLMVAALAFACASKKEDDHEHGSTSDSKEWKEMDEFHMVMAETFHPYKDSANLEPTKSRASELVAAADQWASANLPEKVNNEKTKEKLELLKKETSVLAQTVNTGDDKAIGDQLTKVHNVFHEIQEAWYDGDGDDDDHDHAH
jgi:hypothetical protein